MDADFDTKSAASGDLNGTADAGAKVPFKPTAPPPAAPKSGKPAVICCLMNPCRSIFYTNYNFYFG